ncbi:hypothetical protein FHW12_003138 [Dokdonella fugitiva]|uniref:Uncharacterized protein n=1 Tax=Dokdonella fugitiva TaxID=328517 RepID=A0A839F4D4_9GAMM|nr:hypothetical protein [Dokdonella fugitiva]MBA8888902.1 hypothetical protein [Dokdonella fugitiva]
MNRPSKRPRTETSAEIFERRRKEASEAAASADRTIDPFRDPDALYAQRRARAGHSERLANLT